MTNTEPFDRSLFVADLDRERDRKGVSWRGIAKELKISPSTITRLRQEQTTPDLETFTRLCQWAGLTPATYLVAPQANPEPRDSLSEISALLRADKSLDADGAARVEAIVRAAYENFQQSGS